MKPDFSSKLFPGVQSFCSAAGKWSCYAFCVLKIAERYTGKTLSPIEEIINAIERGYIRYNWENHDDPDNLFVEAPAAWLANLTGSKWTVEKAYTEPIFPFVVEVWNNAHFRLSDWDPLQYSVSVATGKITSWRILNPL